MSTNGNFLNPPLKAKNGHTLMVILVGRVSDPGPGKQDLRSLDEQEQLHRNWLQSATDLPFHVTVVAGSGSGEQLDREEYLQLIDLVASDEYDIVRTEDLGRVARRIHAHLFAEHCVDHETRLISVNDHVDTAQLGWEDQSIFSSWHHERSNRDTSDRIKRTQRGRFMQGGILSTLIPGYIKAQGAKTDAEICRDPDWGPIYNEWFNRLENGHTFAEIADWLNLIGARTGYESQKKLKKVVYDGTLVGQRTRNKLLKGLRERNKRVSRRLNATGHRRSIKASPEDRLERVCPYLAHIEPDRYDRVLTIVNQRNDKYRRKGNNGQDPRKNVSKRRTRFPGQCIFCGICGQNFVYGGHGQTHRLMCQGARDHTCWNGATVNRPLTASLIAGAVSREIKALTGFDAEFEEMLNKEAERINQSLDTRLQQINAELKRIREKAKFIVDEIGAGNASWMLRDELAQLEIGMSSLSMEKDDAERNRVGKIVVPSSEELKNRYFDTFCDLAVDSHEFARTFRCLVPRIVVFPVRLFNDRRAVLRAKFRVKFSTLVDNSSARNAVGELLEKVIEVNLFEPPQREKHRVQVVTLRRSGVTQQLAAKQLGLTTTAAQRAASLQRDMERLGLTDPYVLVTDPEECTRFCRHKHARYKFSRSEDAGLI